MGPETAKTANERKKRKDGRRALRGHGFRKDSI